MPLLLLLLFSSGAGSVVDTEKPDDSCAGSDPDVDVEEFRNYDEGIVLPQVCFCVCVSVSVRVTL